MKKNRFILPLSFSIVLTAGIFVGNWLGTNFGRGNSLNSIIKLNNPGVGSGDMSFSLIPRNNKINSILSYIQNEYVDTVNISQLTEAAIPEMIRLLDPHSVYIPARELEKYNEPLMGNFSGIGIQFNMIEDTVAVINTIPNGPSEIVGIMPGDRIVEVDDTIIAGVKLSSDKVVRKLKGRKGSLVKVGIIRRGEKDILEFEIVRDDIPLYSVDVSYMIGEETGYIKISSFSQTTYQEFMKGVDKLHSEGMNKLILDLRGNGGGLMEPATEIADQFLEADKLIVYTQGKNRPRHEFFSSEKGVCKEDKLVILLDEFSASASEILAGAVQDNDRGTIVGRRSFGKGLVQEQIEFRDNSALRLTIARYYTPTGRSIQKPYSMGDDQYFQDLNTRFVNGEFQNADSIHFADSLKFTTPGGKTVYGGGGIMPDIFVPFDTTGVTPWFNRLRSMGLIYRFAFDYTDKHRNVLSELESPLQIRDYLRNNTRYFNEFLKYSESKGVKTQGSDLKESRELIEVQIEAYVSRNMLDNEGYYPLIRDIDKTLLKALEVIEEESFVVSEKF